MCCASRHWSGRYAEDIVKGLDLQDFGSLVLEGKSHLANKMFHTDSPYDAVYLQYSFLDPLDQLRQKSQDQLNPEISF